MMQAKPRACGVDNMALLFAQGVFLVWVTFGERRWSVVAERRKGNHFWDKKSMGYAVFQAVALRFVRFPAQ
jgi:hypothetical protein